MSPEAIAKTTNTRFKKGNLPHNTRESHGVISIRYKDGEPPYKYIRLKLGRWDLLHKINWEAINGKLPKGHCLRCKDGDTLNCDPENWTLITRQKNMELNTIHRFPEELISTIRILSKLKKTVKNHGTKQINRPA